MYFYLNMIKIYDRKCTKKKKKKRGAASR